MGFSPRSSFTLGSAPLSSRYCAKTPYPLLHTTCNARREIGNTLLQSTSTVLRSIRYLASSMRLQMAHWTNTQTQMRAFTISIWFCRFCGVIALGVELSAVVLIRVGVVISASCSPGTPPTMGIFCMA